VLDLCTNPHNHPGKRICCTAAISNGMQACKSLISLDFLSCALNGQFVGRLDEQGFQHSRTEFSTKLSTDFLEWGQSAEKSTTYTLFQEKA
jgi:hypothetical protein